MFGLGLWEFMLILVVALLVLGPERLPKIARQLGKGMREFRRVASEFQSSFNAADYDDLERQRRARDMAAQKEGNGKDEDKPDE